MTDIERKQAAAQEYATACGDEPFDVSLLRVLHEAAERRYAAGGNDVHILVLGAIDSMRVREQVAYAQALMGQRRRRPVRCGQCDGRGQICALPDTCLPGHDGCDDMICPVQDASGECIHCVSCSACGKDGCGPGVVWEEVQP